MDCSIQRKYTEQDSNQDVCKQEAITKKHTAALKTLQMKIVWVLILYVRNPALKKNSEICTKIRLILGDRLHMLLT